MANPFQIQRSQANRIVVLEPIGYLDAHTAPQFEAAIAKELEEKNIHLVVDGNQLTYISSAGLGVFMGFIEEVREAGGDIKICNLTPKVLQVFEILGFTGLFQVVTSREEAFGLFPEGGN